MNTPEMVQAASRVASGMAGAAYTAHQGALSAEVMGSIVRLSFQIVRKIEEEARNPHPERSHGI
jgi:hypothetical protein